MDGCAVVPELRDAANRSKTEAGGTGGCRLVGPGRLALRRDEGRGEGRGCGYFEAMKLTALDPRITGLVDRRSAVLVVPDDRSGDHCNDDHARVRVPAICAAGGIGPLLNRNCRRSFGLQLNVEALAGARHTRSSRMEVRVIGANG